MKKLAFGLLIGLFGLVLGVASLSPVQAAPAMQADDFVTPTPGMDGQIVYTVQSGDTLYGIALAAGLSLEELLELNNMTEDDVLVVGATLFLGTGPTPDPASLPGFAALITPTPISNSALVCAQLFLDVNGDSLRQDDEILMADGQMTVSEQSGAYFQQGTTTYSLDALCFSVPPGSYDVSMTLPENYYRTTDLEASIDLAAGDTVYFGFGMSPNKADERTDDGDQGGVDPILIIGGVLLVIGAAGGIFVALTNRGSSPDDEEE